MTMTSKEIIKKYIEFYKSKNHVEIPNVSLVPENDSTLLFVNAGMFPLVPYLIGQEHPMGTRLVNIQRCIRFEDMDEVGDNRHTTAFHMLGNWSLNDYFRQEQLPWVYEFIFEVLKLDPERTYATVFGGGPEVGQDEASVEILKKIFAEKGIDPNIGERILFVKGKNNWWQRGDAVGELGGPSSEIFYYIPNDSSKGKGQDLLANEEAFLEIGNSVFLQYVKTEKGWEPMSMNNIDFGGGLERIALAVQGKEDIFETDNFWPIIERLQELTGKGYKNSSEITYHMRIVADHIRASVFLGMDGVLPSNKDQGYVLRRLLRRIVRSGKALGLEEGISVGLVSIVVEMFSWLYPQLPELQSKMEEIFADEEAKFRKTLNKASKEVEKFLSSIKEDAPLSEVEAAQQSAVFYQSLGYPAEDFFADLKERNINLDEKKFLAESKRIFEEHKEKSRVGADQKFKGGLADSEEITVKYHTTAHLLHAALIQVTKSHATQAGSNINSERIRFDFNFDRLLSPEELAEVEKLVNEKIAQKLPVKFEILDKEAAVATGAMHLDLDKYGDKVKVYYVGNSLEEAFSKEFCGGPHVENTADLQPISIYKQEKMGRGVVRVYVRFVE